MSMAAATTVAGCGHTCVWLRPHLWGGVGEVAVLAVPCGCEAASSGAAANQVVLVFFWNHVMWIQRFRTPMEPATRTAGEELSGLSGHIQTVLRTLVCDLIDLGTDWGREMTILASISASKRSSGDFPKPKSLPCDLGNCSETAARAN